MRKLFFASIFCLITTLTTNAQRVIENPMVGSDVGNNSKIEKIELSDTATILYLRTSLPPDVWFIIHKTVYLQPAGSTDPSAKLVVKSSKGLPVDFEEKWTIPDSGVVNYALVFPPLDKSITKIDFIGDEKAKWEIRDIAFISRPTTLPEALMGNWHKDNKWLLGLYDSVAIYNNKLWHYGNISHQKDTWKITLSDKTTAETVYLQAGNNGHCLVGSSPQKMEDCIHFIANYLKYKTQSPNNQLSQPLLKSGYATIKGFIKTYTPLNKSSLSSSSIHCNYYIQYRSDAKINPDGSFELRVPLLHATKLSIDFKYNENKNLVRNIFVEPGDEMTCYFDEHYTTVSNDNASEFLPGAVFMGDNADVNTEMNMFWMKWRKTNYSVFRDSLLHAPQDKYKKLCIEDKRANDEQILTMILTNSISPKTAKIFHVENNLNLCNNLLQYNTYREWYYKNDKNITDYRKTYLTPVKLGFPYLDVVESTLKDSLCLISNELSGIVFNMQTLNEVKKPDTKLTNIMRLMAESGTVFNADEQKLYASLLAIDRNDENATDSFEYFEKLTMNFKNKYSNTIQNIATELQTLTPDAYLQRYFNLSPLMADVLSLREYASKINLTNSSLTTADLKTIHKTFNHTLFADYLENVSKEIKLPEKNEGSVVKDVPDWDGNDVLKGILQQYRGKVVLVDFWETWCIPCRMGMNQMAPLKEELKDNNIAFVCLTSPSSPKDTWNTMNKSIRGDHYRLNQNQYTAFYNKYNLKFVPRYLLADKDGNIVNYDVGHKTNEELKELLLKYTKL